MSVQAERKLCRLFKSGRTNVFDEEWEGRPVSASTNELCVKIDATIKENRNIRLSLLSNELGVAYETVQKIVT